MFNKLVDKKSITSNHVPISANEKGTAVEALAITTSIALLILGLGHLLFPLAFSPFTGIGSDTAGQIIAVQWIAFGMLLFLGGISRLRAITIFAADFIMIASIATLVVVLLGRMNFSEVLIHGSITVLAIASSGFARLSDKAEIKRELHLVREQATSLARSHAALSEKNADAIH